MPGYYADKLSAQRLQRCYEVAPPRVRQYLEAEIEHVIAKVHPGNAVLELGCGYGRVLKPLAAKAESVVGIDSSLSSLQLAKSGLDGVLNCRLLAMDAGALAFRDDVFDVVGCIQNGISAFKVDPGDLARESVRVAKPGGVVLLSTYAEKFWPHRLEWFERQAAEGLLGEIDRDQTGSGVIVCRDGFRATTTRPDDLRALASLVGAEATIEEVDGSSVFCEIRVLA